MLFYPLDAVPAVGRPTRVSPVSSSDLRRIDIFGEIASRRSAQRVAVRAYSRVSRGTYRSKLESIFEIDLKGELIAPRAIRYDAHLNVGAETTSEDLAE